MFCSSVVRDDVPRRKSCQGLQGSLGGGSTANLSLERWKLVEGLLELIFRKVEVS